MAIDLNDIHLSSELKTRMADLAESAGTDWETELSQALEQREQFLVLKEDIEIGYQQSTCGELIDGETACAKIATELKKN